MSGQNKAERILEALGAGIDELVAVVKEVGHENVEIHATSPSQFSLGEVAVTVEDEAAPMFVGRWWARRQYRGLTAVTNAQGLLMAAKCAARRC